MILYFCCHLMTFFQNQRFKASFRNTTRVSYGLYPDQDQRSVGTVLGTNCLQRLSADNTSRRLHVQERVRKPNKKYKATKIQMIKYKNNR